MRLVLDTNVILYHLADRLSAPLPQATISASIISEMETRSYPELSVRDEAVSALSGVPAPRRADARDQGKIDFLAAAASAETARCHHCRHGTGVGRGSIDL